MNKVINNTKIMPDITNKRIVAEISEQVDSFEINDTIDKLCIEKKLTKSFLKIEHSQWIDFLKHGYTVEGVINGFFAGKTAICMAKFYNEERRNSKKIVEENEILQDIHDNVAQKHNAKLNAEYIIRAANKEDVRSLKNLYSEVFVTYPTPITEEKYIKEAMDNNTTFMLIEHNNKVISAASADMNRDYKNAELTDCATDKQYRGQGLMSILIEALEKEMHKEKIKCLFTIARARSYGMNAVFYKHNFYYGGRLINNCDISGQFEDMNIWTKVL